MERQTAENDAGGADTWGPGDGSLRGARYTLLWLHEVTSDGLLRDEISHVRSALADVLEARGGDL